MELFMKTLFPRGKHQIRFIVGLGTLVVKSRGLRRKENIPQPVHKYKISWKGKGSHWFTVYTKYYILLYTVHIMLYTVYILLYITSVDWLAIKFQWSSWQLGQVPGRHPSDPPEKRTPRRFPGRIWQNGSSPWMSLLRTAPGYPFVHVDPLYHCYHLSLTDSMPSFRILTSLIHPWLKQEQYQGPCSHDNLPSVNAIALT